MEPLLQSISTVSATGRFEDAKTKQSLSITFNAATRQVHIKGLSINVAFRLPDDWDVDPDDYSVLYEAEIKGNVRAVSKDGRSSKWANATAAVIDEEGRFKVHSTQMPEYWFEGFLPTDILPEPIIDLTAN